MARILIVDDDILIRETLEAILTSWGHQVDCAANGIKAIKIIESNSIDLVITDIIMPDMDGYELIRKLRKQSDSPKIIAMSGGGFKQDSKELLNTALLMKADNILHKPFDSVSLNNVIVAVLGRA